MAMISGVSSLYGISIRRRLENFYLSGGEKENFYLVRKRKQESQQV
jgi:hypothetical protein